MAKVYKMIHGKRVELNARQIKAEIMKLENWNETQYKREYNITRNRLRNYERFVRESGQPLQKQSVQQFLYFKTRAERVEGYEPSLQMQRILKFSAQSTGKKLSATTIKRSRVTYAQTTSARFSGLINANPKAREIAEAITDPVKREKALSEFANQMHIKIKASGEAEKHSAIPFGAKMGSSESFDFDYSAYI